MANVYFRTADLAVGYQGKALIENINVALEKGEILTLIGPNGSGKSTILKSITKHLAVIGGDSFVADASVGAMTFRQLSRKMAVVLTERIRGELLTCYDVVASGRYPYTNTLGLLSAEDRAKVTAAMTQVHAAELAERDFTAISDGQRQRILLARAICQEPELIVLDEPTSFLDVAHKLELLSLLRAMAKERGITVIMSLHEIDLAQKVSDKVMCVSGSQIAHFGTPEEIFRPDIIEPLYGIAPGTYNVAFGSVELPAPSGTPRTFVLSGCGSGIGLFRRLQKEERPFYAGILFTNDLDYPVARQLAARVFAAQPFAPIPEAVCREALGAMAQCDEVIVTDFPLREGNAPIEKLIAQAEAMGKLRRA